jgi:hypothetical protein
MIRKSFLIGIALRLADSQSADLAFTDSMKMMDMQVFIAFALSVPHHGHFD